MDQAAKIIARLAGPDGVTSLDKVACGAWKRAVGRKVAIRTTALKLVRERLVVEVEDNVWRENLWSLRFQILRNLEKEIGHGIVTELEFRIMPLRKGPQRAVALSVSAENADEADEIKDPGLRRIYRNSRSKSA